MGIKTLAAKTIFKVKANSPKILLGTGVIAGVCCIAFTIKGTIKAVPIIADAEEELKTAKAIKDVNENGAVVTTDDGTEVKPLSTKKIKLKTAGKIARVYAVAGICGAVSLISFLKCYGIMNNRLVDATVYGTAMAAKAKNMYNKVAERFGKEVADELYYGNTTKTVKKTNPDTGEEYEEVVPNMEKGAPWYSCYSFEYQNESYQPGFDQMQLEHDQDWWNKKLDAEDYILFSDVINSFSATQKEHIVLKGSWCGVGWISKKWIDRLVAAGVMKENDYLGDGRISFGIFDGRGGEQAKLWREGKTRSVILDFNVDGPIYTYIDAINRMKYMSDEDFVSYISDHDTAKYDSKLKSL